MKKQVVLISSLLIIDVGLTFPCHSASLFIKNAVKIPANYYTRTLACRQPEFPEANHFIDQYGKFTDKVRWLKTKDSEEKTDTQVMIAYKIPRYQVTLNRLAAKTISISRKATIPLGATTALGGIGGLVGSVKFGDGDGAILAGMVVTGYATYLGMIATGLCSAIGYNPASLNFLKHHNKRIFLKDKSGAFYSGYPHFTKLLETQGVFEKTHANNQEARHPICAEKI